MPARRPVTVIAASDIVPPAGALSADEIDDRFHRLLLGLPAPRSSALSAEEQMVLHRVRDAFGGERIEVAALPRVPAVVPIMMRALQVDRSDMILPLIYGHLSKRHWPARTALG
ncbi:hypothetical protein [Luteibacter sp.]|uniref:hypothetical protein n=1 Tax=Luteibacter sp. TaxID=1886636 RepID=UPI0025B94861|nr:hypothetical protein [Luteibacter sp.]